LPVPLSGFSYHENCGQIGFSREKESVTMTGEQVFVIGQWVDPRSKTITLQEFKQGDESFIPIFSDENHFRDETKDSGFEDQGIARDRDFFISVLRGDELLIMNPGSSNPTRLRKSDIV
jgi:hypothetical protein